MKSLTYNQIADEYGAKGYIFRFGLYELNLFGIRSKNPQAGLFDDTIGVAWVDENGLPNVFMAAATTDPGSYYLKQPMNPAGTAILVPGYYPQMFALGMHRSTPALVQVNKCNVYRDNNRDDRLDMDTQNVYTGIFGINMHRAQAVGKTAIVGRYSAGCQVLQDSINMENILALVRLQKKYAGMSTIDYVLFYEPEMKTIKRRT